MKSHIVLADELKSDILKVGCNHFNHRHFKSGNGKGFGDEKSDELIDLFGLSQATNNSYDWGFGLVKGEVKASRATIDLETDDNHILFIEKGALSSDLDFNTSGWQQIKPNCYQYIIGVISFLDCDKIWVIPTIDFGKEKLPLSKQHRGQPDPYIEGQFTLSKSRMDKNMKPYYLGKLDQDTDKNTIVAKLHEIIRT